MSLLAGIIIVTSREGIILKGIYKIKAVEVAAVAAVGQGVRVMKEMTCRMPSKVVSAETPDRGADLVAGNHADSGADLVAGNHADAGADLVAGNNADAGAAVMTTSDPRAEMLMKILAAQTDACFLLENPTKIVQFITKGNPALLYPLPGKVKSSLAGSPPMENLLPQVCGVNYQLLVGMLPK